MRYKVTVIERTTIGRSKIFVADDSEAAQELAESEDWQTWGEDYSDADCGIETVEEVK